MFFADLQGSLIIAIEPGRLNQRGFGRRFRRLRTAEIGREVKAQADHNTTNGAHQVRFHATYSLFERLEDNFGRYRSFHLSFPAKRLRHRFSTDNLTRLNARSRVSQVGVAARRSAVPQGTADRLRGG